MIENIVTLAAGFVLGLLTGFYFERRALAAARGQSEELGQELESIRHSVYSLGGAVEPQSPSTQRGDLADQVGRRARAIQDPSGRLNKLVLIAYFVGQGHGSDEIEEAIALLCANGSARDSGKWLEMA